MTRQEIEVLLAESMDREIAEYDPPTPSDWTFLREKFRTDFPAEFVYFIDLMSVYAFPGEILNVARSGRTNGNDTIAAIYDAEAQTGRWNADLIPFYRIGNGDYFCLNAQKGKQTGVFYFYHEDGRIEAFSDTFEFWLKGLNAFLDG